MARRITRRYESVPSAIGPAEYESVVEPRDDDRLAIRLEPRSHVGARLAARVVALGSALWYLWLFAAGAMILALLAAADQQSFLLLAHELFFLGFLALTIVGASTLYWMLHAWRDHESLDLTRFSGEKLEPQLSFSLIVPARHEEAVLAATIGRLKVQQHPRFEVIIVVGHDDSGTHAVAEQAIDDDPRFQIVVDTSEQKNKPKALNTALPFCRGEVVGVFDAEDQVAEGLLASVDAQFVRTGAHIVQGATQLMNFRSNWFSVRNVLEYYFWFKSRLHFHANAGFIPLGGNTVFVQSDWLRSAGGWDPDCLAEDCDLGSRLSSMGARTVVAYTPELVTREETPDTAGALLRQRTRWNQGFLQVLRKGEWRALPFRSRLLAAYTLSFPFLQAAMFLILPLLIAAVFLLELPVILALFSFVPLIPLVAILAAELMALDEFGREYSDRPGILDYARLILGFIPYQLLLSAAAGRAAYRELRGYRDWEKTAHVGAHL